ncbi:MAG: hypothetical protein WAL13_28770, partial [Trebonia sp.]
MLVSASHASYPLLSSPFGVSHATGMGRPPEQVHLKMILVACKSDVQPPDTPGIRFGTAAPA